MKNESHQEKGIMKQKKANIRKLKYQKKISRKPDRKKEILRYLGRFAVCSAVFCYAVTKITFFAAIENNSLKEEQALKNIRTAVSDAYSREVKEYIAAGREVSVDEIFENPEFRNNLSFKMSTAVSPQYSFFEDAELLSCCLIKKPAYDALQKFNNFGVILYDENGNSVADTKERIYLIAQNKEIDMGMPGRTRLLVCDDRINDQLINILKNTSFFDYSTLCKLEFESVRVKDGKYIPEKVCLYTDDREDDQKLIQEYALDDLVTWDTSDYEVITEDENINLVAGLCVGKNNLPDITDECYRQNDVTIEDRTFTVYLTNDFTPFEEYKELYMFMYIMAAILTVAAAIPAGCISYGKKLLPYELDAYRRRTTNAMAHDLKSPLMALSGYAENIVKTRDEEKLNHYSSSILDTVSGMNGIIESILELSKIEEDSMKLEKTEIQLDEIIRQELEKYEITLSDKHVSCKINGSKKITADKFWISRLADNLIGNAVKYSSSDSEIKINLTDRELSVENKYDGTIDCDEQQLLEAFYKGDKARSSQDGTGLGLSIARSIAERHEYVLSVSYDNQLFRARVTF